MDIAVVAWGSLVWDPGDLGLASRWHKDGPVLPIEFARLSSNGTATLVVTEDWGSPVQTYWAFSSASDLTAARLDLQRRERTPDLRSIGGVTAAREILGWERLKTTGQVIAKWATEKGIDAAIWTGLKAKGFEGLSEKERAGWRQGLERSADQQVETYVRRAPAQVDTPLRRCLVHQLGWHRIPLPARLFADSVGESGE